MTDGKDEYYMTLTYGLIHPMTLGTEPNDQKIWRLDRHLQSKSSEISHAASELLQKKTTRMERIKMADKSTRLGNSVTLSIYGGHPTTSIPPLSTSLQPQDGPLKKKPRIAHDGKTNPPPWTQQESTSSSGATQGHTYNPISADNILEQSKPPNNPTSYTNTYPWMLPHPTVQHTSNLQQAADTELLGRPKGNFE